LILFVVGALIGYLLFSHVQARVSYWLHALEPGKVNDFGYGQLAQSWFALASGGLVGSGLGRGAPDLIPFPASDFILSAFGEELGMLGTAAILLLFVALIGRGLRIALDRDDSFGRLFASGLTVSLALQTLTIAAGVTRLIPLTGVPLPFVSYGGTSKVASFVIVALLVRISAGPWRPAWRRG
jgi:cell division protein FtsW (lipid II flippase)